MAANPVGEAIHQYWENSADSSDVFFFTLIDELGQPYSCEQWGDFDELSIPLMIDDGEGFEIYNWFSSTPNSYPVQVFIDHQMRIDYIYNGFMSEFSVSEKIQEMLERME